jgi:hypothetical protein
MRGKIAIWLFVILLLSVAVVQSGKYSFDMDRGLEKTGSNGTAAFAELVKLTYPGTKIADQLPKDGSLTIIPYTTQFESDLRRLLRSEARPGKYILFKVTDYPGDGKPKPVDATNTATGKSLGLLTGVSTEWDGSLSEIFSTDEESVPFEEWTPSLLPDTEAIEAITTGPNATTIATIQSSKGITLYCFEQASALTNAHISEANNADIFMGFIEAANSEKRPLTIIKSFLNGSTQQGLVERLGPVVHSIWNQFLVLLAVVFLTLNIRFGKAREPRAEQRSARELVDGVGNFARRKQLGRWALQCVYSQTMLELERRHRTSRQQLLNRPEDFLSEDQARALVEAQRALSIDLSAKDALTISRRLRRLV